MKEIDKAKLRVDQAHVQEAVSMATSQYAADHTEGKRWYYYDANRSEIKKDTSEGIHGYGKSTKEPYKHNTHVTDNSASSVPVGADGTRNLVEVTVNVEHGVSTITSSWVQSGNHPYTPPQHNKDNSDKKTFGDVEITAAGDWLLQQNYKENESRYYSWGYVYQFQGDSKYYLVIDTGVGECNRKWSATPSQSNTLDVATLDFSKVYTYKGLQDYAKAHDNQVPLWTPVISDDRTTIYLCKNEWVVGASLTETGKFVPVYGATLKAGAKPFE